MEESSTIDMFSSEDENEDLETRIHCGTTAGDFELILYREWSPLGYERALQLFERGFYDHSHFFRVIPNFLAQFGISYTKDEDLQRFADTTIPDDPQLDPPIPFDEGIISFAGSGIDSRTSHLFIAYGPVESFGLEPWETPIGEVVQGMDTIRSLYSSYGDGFPDGTGPSQQSIHEGGEAYMVEHFPKLDRFTKCFRVPLENNEGEEVLVPEENEKVEIIKPIRDENDQVTYLRDENKLVKGGRRGRAAATSWGLILSIIILALLYLIGKRFRPFTRKNRKSA